MEFSSRLRQHQNSAVKASVQLDDHKTQWKVRFDACGSRLSMEVTPAVDVWPWLVRHAGWLLERYHVKGNKKRSKIVSANRTKER